MRVIATQKNVTSYLKEWQEAESISDAIKHAKACAEEFDGLYEESAKNLLERTPDLLLLLSAFLAGQQSVTSEQKEGTLL